IRARDACSLVSFFTDLVIYVILPLLLHDARPICSGAQARLVYSMSRDNMLPFSGALRKINARSQTPIVALLVFGVIDLGVMFYRSEEHTSELQSPDHLVYRLLLGQQHLSKHQY